MSKQKAGMGPAFFFRSDKSIGGSLSAEADRGRGGWHPPEFKWGTRRVPLTGRVKPGMTLESPATVVTILSHVWGLSGFIQQTADQNQILVRQRLNDPSHIGADVSDFCRRSIPIAGDTGGLGDPPPPGRALRIGRKGDLPNTGSKLIVALRQQRQHIEVHKLPVGHP
jgi:hypothetical protein